jgi:hypothetical protein
MKKLLLLFCLAVALPVLPTGCSTAPSARVIQVQTLKAVGQSAKTALDASTQLLKQGTITVAQWQKVADAYDHKFQPAFNLAVAAAQSDLSSVASPDLVALGTQIVSLVAELSTTRSP